MSNSDPRLSADSAIQAILEGWFGEAIEHMDDGKRVRKFLLEPLIKAASSCGAESNRHSGAVGAEKRAEQSNPGGGHEVTDSNSQHENRDKPLPDEPTPAAGRLMPNDAQSSQVAILRDALKNMMGAYDTPLSRRRFPPDEFMKAAIESGRAALAAQPPAAPVDPLHDSRNPNHGRSGGLRDPEPAAPVETGYNLATGERDNEETDPTYFHCSAANGGAREALLAAQAALSDGGIQNPMADDALNKIAIALREMRAQPQEAPTCPGKGWLAPALESAERRAAEMPDWMRRDKAPEDEGELVVTQYQLMAAQSALREIAGMSHNCRSVDIAKAALAMMRPKLCPNGLEHGACLHPNCVSSCPGRLSLSQPSQLSRTGE